MLNSYWFSSTWSEPMSIKFYINKLLIVNTRQVSSRVNQNWYSGYWTDIYNSSSVYFFLLVGETTGTIIYLAHWYKNYASHSLFLCKSRKSSVFCSFRVWLWYSIKLYMTNNLSVTCYRSRGISDLLHYSNRLLQYNQNMAGSGVQHNIILILDIWP